MVFLNTSEKDWQLAAIPKDGNFCPVHCFCHFWEYFKAKLLASFFVQSFYSFVLLSAFVLFLFNLIFSLSLSELVIFLSL